MKMRTLSAFLMAAMIALCCSCETAPEREYPELEYGIKAYLDMSIYFSQKDGYIAACFSWL